MLFFKRANVIGNEYKKIRNRKWRWFTMVLILLLAFTQTEKPAESFKYYACADDSEIYNA